MNNLTFYEFDYYEQFKLVMNEQIVGPLAIFWMDY